MATNNLFPAEKVVLAKALRKSFSDAQQDILKSTHMSNDWLLEKMREAQEENRLFRKLVDEIQEENEGCVEYRVEQAESPVIDGKEHPDFRVVLYVNGEWLNEWGVLWSKSKATEVSNQLNKKGEIKLK